MMRNKVSSSNKYYISDHRRLELKHVCMQYPEWEKEYVELSEASLLPKTRYEKIARVNTRVDPVALMATRKAELFRKMELIDTIALEVDEPLAKYILQSVIYGYSYDYFNTRIDIPCGRDYFYDRIRKFYYVLDQRWR